MRSPSQERLIDVLMIIGTGLLVVLAMFFIGLTLLF